MASPPWFPPLARLALVLGIVGAVVAGASYVSWASTWNRPKPKVQACFRAVGVGLSKPEVASGNEPNDAGDGRTVYLTKAADRAVRCAADLGPRAAQRVADALGEIEPDDRAAKLIALMEAVPKDESGDKEALSLGYIAEAGIDALPRTEVVIAADRKIAGLVDCRFGGSGCQDRPAVPVLTWIGGGLGAVGLLVALAYVGRAAAARAAARRAKA